MMTPRTIGISFSKQPIAESERNKPHIEKLNETFLEGVSVHYNAFQGNIA